MKKLEELLKKRESELEAEEKQREIREKARKRDFNEKLISLPFAGGFFGLLIGLVLGFFKSCGLFHYNVGHAEDAYLFKFEGTGELLFYCLLIGAIIGFVYALISQHNE